MKISRLFLFPVFLSCFIFGGSARAAIPMKEWIDIQKPLSFEAFYEVPKSGSYLTGGPFVLKKDKSDIEKKTNTYCTSNQKRIEPGNYLVKITTAQEQYFGFKTQFLSYPGGARLIDRQKIRIRFDSSSAIIDCLQENYAEGGWPSISKMETNINKMGIAL